MLKYIGELGFQSLKAKIIIFYIKYRVRINMVLYELFSLSSQTVLLTLGHISLIDGKIKIFRFIFRNVSFRTTNQRRVKHTYCPHTKNGNPQR